jgi:arylsulfatase A-like enzyme
MRSPSNTPHYDGGKQPSRRRFLAGAGLALGLTGASGCAVQPRAAGGAAKPNILFILADDLGHHQTAPYGSAYFETPVLRSFARQGMLFSNAYAAAPICSPTRASILTGKSPARLHLTNYIPGASYPYAKLRIPEWRPFLPMEELTLAEILNGAGYTCGHFGKWHLNEDKDYRPGRPGDPGSQGFLDVLTTEKPESDQDPCGDAHNVARITQQAIGFLRARRAGPFFCYVAHNSIHRPEMECAGAVAKYASKPGANAELGNNPVEAAMMETLDRGIGTLLSALDELGLREKTIVVFFSDNGPLHGFRARKPLFGGKGDLYEGGIRVPMIVRWPGVIKPGTTCEEPVISSDFLPTFAAAAGAQTPAGMDGVSLLPLWRGDGKPDRDALCFHYPHYHRLNSSNPPMSHPVAPHGAIRQGRFKLIEWFESSVANPEDPRGYSLFDLQTDPGESRDIAADQPETVRRLASRLRAWRQETGAQMPTMNPDHDPLRASWRHAGRE